MQHCQRWTYFLLNPTFISLSFLYQMLSAEFLSKFQNFFEVEINQVNLTPCWVHWVRGPFNYYVRKEVGGWGQKIAIFADLQHFLCWRRCVGLKKPKTCWRNTWMVPTWAWLHKISVVLHSRFEIICHNDELSSSLSWQEIVYNSVFR